MNPSDATNNPGAAFDINRDGYKDMVVFKNNIPYVIISDSAGPTDAITYALSNAITIFRRALLMPDEKWLLQTLIMMATKIFMVFIATIGLVRTTSFNSATSKYN